MARNPRDIERMYSTHEVVAKLRRLADALEKDESFRIQIAGVRIRVPERAQFSIEHELDGLRVWTKNPDLHVIANLVRT